MHTVCMYVSTGLRALTAAKGVRSYMLQSRVFVGMVLILIFGEVLGLYGYDDDYNELSIA